MQTQTVIHSSGKYKNEEKEEKKVIHEKRTELNEHTLATMHDH